MTRHLFLAFVAVAIAAGQANAGTVTGNAKWGFGPNPGERIIIVNGDTTLDKSDKKAVEVKVTLVDPMKKVVPMAALAWNPPLPGQTTQYIGHSEIVTVLGVYECTVRFTYIDAKGESAHSQIKFGFLVE